MRRGQPDTRWHPHQRSVRTRVRVQSISRLFVFWASCPLSPCPPPPPTFRRCEWQGGGDRSPPVPTVHTGACVTLLDYYYLSFPLSFDLSLSATLQNINFAFWNFSAGGLNTPARYLYLYLICRWCNTIGVELFFPCSFHSNDHRDILSSHESFRIFNLFQAHYFPTLFFVTAPRIFLKLPNIFCHCENPINCERVIMGVKTFHLAEKLKVMRVK